MAKEICYNCGKTFETKKGWYCPECRKKVISDAAKKRNLNKLGLKAQGKNVKEDKGHE